MNHTIDDCASDDNGTIWKDLWMWYGGDSYTTNIDEGTAPPLPTIASSLSSSLTSSSPLLPSGASSGARPTPLHEIKNEHRNDVVPDTSVSLSSGNRHKKDRETASLSETPSPTAERSSDAGDSTEEDCATINCEPNNANDNANANANANTNANASDRSESHLLFERTKERMKLLQDIDDQRWKLMFRFLLQYKAQYGNTLVPCRVNNNPRLGTWVRKQRNLYNKNQLKIDRVQSLESIGFLWIVPRSLIDANKWEVMYKALLQYKKQHGDTLVPDRYQQNPRLATWVKGQKNMHSRRKLDKNRFERLDSIGFRWWGQKQCSGWDAMFQSLMRYKIRHGNTLVPHGYKKNPGLALWVMDQRRLLSKKNMGNHRVYLLEAIGFL